MAATRTQVNGAASGIWMRTVGDLIRPKWTKRARAFASGRHAVEDEVSRAYREPALSQRDHEGYEKYHARLERCLAFGQHATPVPAAEQPTAQHGLFGTSAAFQILGGSRWARSVLTPPNAPGTPAWRLSFLRTLNFIDLVLATEEVAAEDDLWSSQKAMLVRVCQLIRAICQNAPVLKTIKPTGDEDGAVIADLHADLPALCSDYMATLHEVLAACVTTPSALSGSYTIGAADERTWTYSTKSASGPKNADEWVFVWAQVLSCLSRARRAELWTEEQCIALCRASDFSEFVKIVCNPPPDLDSRVRLFGLWALSHFDGEAPAAPLSASPGAGTSLSHLYLTDKERKSVGKCIVTECKRLLARDASLTDSWTPYSLKPDGKVWHDDYMVVPTVPVVLGLVARYMPRALCDSRILRLVSESLDRELQRDIGRAKPYQIGNRDGMVNLAYWHEAYSALEAASGRVGAKWWRRAGATLYGTGRAYGRLTVVAVVVIVTTLSYLRVIAKPPSVIAGLAFGLGAAYIAAVSAPPAIAFLWGNRYR